MAEVYKFTFNNMEYIILDKFEFEGKKYMYIVEDFSKKAKEGEPLKIIADFVYKCEDGKYANVVDDELYALLTREVTQRNLENKNKIRNFYDSQLEKDSK